MGGGGGGVCRMAGEKMELLGKVSTYGVIYPIGYCWLRNGVSNCPAFKIASTVCKVY